MSPVVLALLATALSASEPAGAGVAVALSSIPMSEALVVNALPAPPEKVTLQTRYYGTVTVDHVAHLARKAHCKDCHGPGPVNKIEFTPAVAHERCQGCHQEQKRGPTECRGCHVGDAPQTASPTFAQSAPPAETPPAAPQSTVAASEPSAKTPEASLATPEASVSTPGPSASTASPTVPEPSPTAAALGAAAALAAVVEAPADELELWRVTLGATVGTGSGASVQGAWRRGRFVLSQGLDRVDGRSARTLALAGAGAVLPLPIRASLAVIAQGLGGFDAVERPKVTLVTAAGARVSVAWSPARIPGYALQLSVTGVLDLFHGSFVSPATVYATVGIGMSQR